MDKAIKNKVAKQVLPAVDVIYGALRCESCNARLSATRPYALRAVNGAGEEGCNEHSCAAMCVTNT